MPTVEQVRLRIAIVRTIYIKGNQGAEVQDVVNIKGDNKDRTSKDQHAHTATHHPQQIDTE
jgi:ribosomal protein S19E (S16A)